MISNKHSIFLFLVIGILLPVISLSFYIDNNGKQSFNLSDINGRRSNRPVKKFTNLKLSKTTNQLKRTAKGLPSKQEDGDKPDQFINPNENSSGLNKSPIIKSSGVNEYGIQKNRDDCLCVPYYLCDNGKVIEDGSGLIDPRIGTKKAGEMKKIETTIKGKSTIKEEVKANPLYCGTFHICCSEPHVKPVQPYLHRCGIQNPTGINSRILSPDKKGEADFGEWPWQAAILFGDSGRDYFQCGGTLIDDYFVVTVAHCVAKYVSQPGLKVRLGEWDTANENEFYPHEDFGIERIIIHPEFKNSNLWNDIALIKLDRQVKFKPNIDSVCLPSFGENHEHQECITTGWGISDFKRGTHSAILKEISVQVVSRETCELALRQTRLGARFRLHQGFICAGGQESRDSCKGDGGGPLVCYRQDGTYSLVGLVSWGIDCGQKDVPGVYMDLTKYLDWIISTTGKEISYYSPPVSQNINNQDERN